MPPVKYGIKIVIPFLLIRAKSWILSYALNTDEKEEQV